jgi:hypothetical protein
MKFLFLMWKLPVVYFLLGKRDAVRAFFLLMALCVFNYVDFTMPVVYGTGMASD